MFGHMTPLQLADFPVAVLLVLAVASVGVYGIILAGWSSGSTYPLLGGLRSTAQVISYEIAMGLALVAVFIYSGSMSTSQIVCGAGLALVHRARPVLVRGLRRDDGRRDQPAAVRPRRGRGRADRRLPHRVRLDAVRDVLPRRVHQHVHRLGARDDDVPRRLAGPAARLAHQRQHVQRRLVGRAVVHGQAWLFMFVFVWLRGSLPRDAVRPVHALRVEVPHPGRRCSGSSSSPSSAAPRTAGSATTS